MKIKFFFIPIIILAILILNACSKKDDGTNSNPNPQLATITSSSVNDITQTSGISGGNVTSDGGASVSARGVCWSINQSPTISSNKTSDGTGKGVFTSNITGLNPNTKYYVRAYATNSVGTSYGSEVSFTTQSIAVQVPVLTTIAVTNLHVAFASSGGNISSDGGATITARGVCWNTTSLPTIADNKTIDGTGKGSFTSTLTGLTVNVTYHVRAYASNSAGTAYGNEISFLASPSLGDSFQGGIVAYILKSGDSLYIEGEVHGFIAAKMDQSTAIAWEYKSGITTGAVTKGLGAGHSNTDLIVAKNGIGTYAAKICYNLVLGGYDDWYLPSRDELYKLYLNRTIIGGFSTSKAYWSSTENRYSTAWGVDFTDGQATVYYKSDNIKRVRAIRSF